MPRKEINLRVEVLDGGYCVNGEEWSRERLADYLARQKEEGNRIDIHSVPCRNYVNWKHFSGEELPKSPAHAMR